MLRYGRKSKFAEWASNFSEGLFVVLKVYADESVSEGIPSSPIVPSIADTDPEHLPLQAADLCVYAHRQYIENWEKSGKEEAPELRTLDLLLKWNREENLRKIPKSRREAFVKALNKDRREKMVYWKNDNIKKTYHPALDYPFDKHAKQKRNTV
jgi:hypothetical protein